MSAKLKICYLGDGGSIHTQRWVEHFSKLGHDVYLISNNPVEFKKAKVYCIPGKGILNFIKRTFESRKIIKNLKPDIVHAHFITDFGFMGAMSGFHPLIVSTWGSDVLRQPDESLLFRFMVKYAMKKADVIHCGDDNGATRVRVLVGGRGTIREIGWGVDSEMFKPMPKKEHEGVRILYLRISHDKYGTNALLEAIPKVLRKHKNVKFLILNKGEQLDRTLNTIKKAGVESNVEMIEPIKHSDLPQFMNDCDIYVDTYYSEITGSALGIALLEAMSCGMPVIVANTHGYEQSVRHKVSGYVYKGLDSDALAKALDEVILDANLRKEMGKNARNYVLKHQNWHENMDKMEALYLDLAAKSREKKLPLHK